MAETLHPRPFRCRIEKDVRRAFTGNIHFIIVAMLDVLFHQYSHYFDDYFYTVVIFLQNKSLFTIKMCNFAVIKARILIFYGT